MMLTLGSLRIFGGALGVAHSSVKGLCIDVCEVGTLGELLLPAGALMHTQGVRAASSPPEGPHGLWGQRKKTEPHYFT